MAHQSISGFSAKYSILLTFAVAPVVHVQPVQQVRQDDAADQRTDDRTCDVSAAVAAVRAAAVAVAAFHISRSRCARLFVRLAAKLLAGWAGF